MMYEFRVDDEEGLWGSLRTEAPSEDSARWILGAWLVQEEEAGALDYSSAVLTLD